jgi:hypothetical protein
MLDHYCLKTPCYNLCMSKVAGILLLLLGAATVYVGVREIFHLDQLTPYAAWSSVVLGLLMMMSGAGHFRAPHKAFIISVPVLLTFQMHVYSLGLFYNIQNLRMLLVGFVAASLLILLLSFIGYRKMQAAAQAHTD